MTIAALSKTGLKTAILEAMYNEILSNSNTYYYFLGQTLKWPEEDSDVITEPLNSAAYETQTRNEIIYLKKITSSDISFVVKRYNWSPNKVFDQYDDRLGEYITHLGCIVRAGEGNFNNKITTLTSFDRSKIPVGSLVVGTGVAIGARVISVDDDEITVSEPNVSNFDGSLKFVNVSYSGATSLEDAQFYCVTTDLSVYKCIYNNNNAPSTIKPYGNTFELLKTSDGYVWKYMYTIPTASVNRFMSIDDIPITTALTNQYYSRGAISSVTALSHGSGYTGTVSLTVRGNGHLKDNVYRVTSVTVQTPGSGYEENNPPNITFSDPVDDVISFTPLTYYNLGQYIKTDDSALIYEVMVAGTTGNFTPTHTSSDLISNGSTVLKFVGKTLTGNAVVTDDGVVDIQLDGLIGYINVSNQGSGYDAENPPVVSFASGNAVAVAEVAGGKVVRIRVTDRGSNYTGSTTVSIEPPPGFPETGERASANVEIYYGWGYSIVPTVTIDNPLNGNTATVIVNAISTTAILNPIVDNGQVIGAIVGESGVGYTTASIEVDALFGSGAVLVPNLSFGDLNTRQANIELMAIPGTVDSIAIINPGLNYTSGSATITIEGDGVGCTIDQSDITISNGAITQIKVTNPGMGYSYANVIISGSGNETPAYARAIISPTYGHGKNAVRELFARNISLSTSVGLDFNQGVKVDNDYRQIGIIKNPYKYGTTERYSALSGSTCYNITGAFNLNYLRNDMILWSGAGTGNSFRVVAIPEESTLPLSILVISLGASTLSPGSRLFYQNDSNDWEGVTLENVIKPNIDKYSGELMLIDNRAAFQPTNSQTVSIKTAIRL